MYDIIESYINYKNKPLKSIKEDYESNFDEYRFIIEEEMKEYINKNLGELPIHQLLQQLNLDDLIWGYVCVCLYPSAIWDKNSIYPRIETGYVFKTDMNDELVEKLSNQTFTQGSAISKVKYYNPKNL